MATILVVSTLVLFAVFSVTGILFAWAVWFSSQPAQEIVIHSKAPS